MTIRTYEGAVAIVTGAASGIGAAVSAELARRGAEVFLADIQPALNDKTAEAIRAAGGKATAETVDVRDLGSVESFVAKVTKRAGRLDYVFNNAGTGVFGETHLLEPRDWDLVADVNFRGMLHVVRATYPRLVAQGFGHLVNTASIAGLMSSPILSLYSATKHAVVGLSKGMRIEGARHGVRVSALCPGAVRTPILTGGAQGRSIYDVDPARILKWWDKMMPVDVEPFAKDTLDCVAKNEGVIVLPKRMRPILALLRSVPALEELLASRLYKDTLKDFPEMLAMKPRTTSTGQVDVSVTAG